MSIPFPHIPVGGRLRLFTSEWYTLTKDPEIIQMVVGCPIDLKENIDHNRPMKELKFSPEEEKAADDHIAKLLQKNAIVHSEHEPGEFMSNVFLCPKKDGGYRMILNLKKFNKFTEKIHFKMETIETILQLVTPYCYMYIVIPFGLTSAPRLFTKLLKPFLAHLRSLGFVVTFYLDDGWQKGDTFEGCLKNCEVTYNVLVSCGFIPNDKKSVLIPTQKIEILGHIVDSVKMCVTLPAAKTQKIVALCEELLHAGYFSIRHLAKVIGSLISCTKVCVLGQLHYCSMERLKVEALRSHNAKWDKTVYLNDKCFTDLSWWISHLPHAIAPVRRNNPEITVYSDACDYGWGMVVNGVIANGHFSEKELPLSINTKETLAIWYGLKSHIDLLKNKHVLLQSDNTTAISYVKKFGGMQSELRDKIASDIWNFAVLHGCWLSISHISGSSNIDADIASRILSEKTEWEICPKVFKQLCRHFNFEPEVDLFASHLNSKVKTYYSFTPDPNASHVDTFTIRWHNNSYLFPPFICINRLL